MSVYGSQAAPSQNTINYDAIMSTSLFNYQRTLTDNISKSNAFYYKMQEAGMYNSLDGGVAIQIPLMYALGTFEWYDSYDTLNVDPTDGMTSVFFDWRQAAVPVTISRKEERQNSSTDRIIDLLKAKILQAELGIKQGFNQALLQGSYSSGGSNLFTNPVNPFNGSLGIEPLFNLVNPNTSASMANPVLAGVNYQSQTWWNNQFLQSTLTGSSNSSSFLAEAQRIFNNCSKGPGGPPDLCLVDQTTYEIWNTAYYQVYRRDAATDDDFPFPNIKFHNCIVTWDEFVPDVFNNTVTPLTGVGTALFLNTNFLHVKYDTESNFVATPFVKPVNQDARVAHILWMGNACVSNRRKQGVWYNIPRTLGYVV